jgi:hypothetical protein
VKRHFCGNEIKEGEKDRGCRNYGRNYKCIIWILIKSHEWKNPVGRLRHRYEDKIKPYLK